MQNGIRFNVGENGTRRAIFGLLLLAGALALPRAALAAKDGNGQIWRPSPHSQDLFQVYGVKVNHGFSEKNLTAYAMYNVASDVMDDQLDVVGTMDIIASLALVDHLSIGLDMPLHLHHSGDYPGLQSFSAGDLRASIKAAAYRPRRYGVGVGVSLDLFLPTGGEDALTSEPGFAMQPRLLLEGSFKWVYTAVNVGYMKRFETASLGDVKIEDQLEFMLGLGIRLGIPELQLILEGDIASNVNQFWDDDLTRFEIDGGLRYRMENGAAFQLGGGGGLMEGYGDPGFRFFASVGYMPATWKPLPPKDRDGDGLKDPVDACPLEPEDFDGFQDEDGCPELDNDRDGIPDTSDRCPLEPEDFDSFEDADGCPDVDNDGDGILDPNDGCPMDAEDKDGFQDEDGCPEPGNVCVTEEKLVITDKIYFKTNRAEIKSVSFPLLDEIAQVIIDHPEILLIEVQGHTDDRGSDRYNLKLSDKRAKAVRDYLVKRGHVDPKRLTGKGYGETVPIADNESEEGRALNRRVEFIIMQRAPKPE